MAVRKATRSNPPAQPTPQHAKTARAGGPTAQHAKPYFNPATTNSEPRSLKPCETSIADTASPWPRLTGLSLKIAFTNRRHSRQAFCMAIAAG